MKDIPAFPKTPFIELGTPQNGMTLRDYFAGKAMQALLTRETRISEDAMLYAGAAYDVADAMMKAREA
jgi:hypothetical protein